MAANSASSAAFQHSRHAASSPPVPAGRAEQLVSAVVSGVASAQLGAYPSIERSDGAHAASILGLIFPAVSPIFTCAGTSGQGPMILPTFSASRHFSCTFRYVFLYLRSPARSVFWHFAGSACAGAASASATRTTSSRSGERDVIGGPPRGGVGPRGTPIRAGWSRQ